VKLGSGQAPGPCSFFRHFSTTTPAAALRID
jgi:hypothetical protein